MQCSIRMKIVRVMDNYEKFKRSLKKKNAAAQAIDNKIVLHKKNPQKIQKYIHYIYFFKIPL